MFVVNELIPFEGCASEYVSLFYARYSIKLTQVESITKLTRYIECFIKLMRC